MVQVTVDGGGDVDTWASGTAQTDDHEQPVARSAAPPRRAGLVGIHPLRGNAPPLVFRVNGDCWLGRSREAPFRVEDARVSRRHATFAPRAEGVFVRDDGSRHGTFVNAARVSGHGALARHGDVLGLGDLLFLVVCDVERYAAEPRRIDGASLGLQGILLAGPELAEIWDEAHRLSRLREPVLVLGESGSGKECVARLLHEGARAGVFVGLNVSAVPDSLFEAELFGHERGAFTGAAAARLGAFREARGGTLFLDEVAELKLENQAKLLRALDAGHVRPLGSKGEAHVDARLVSATNRDLERACEAGQFRADLYYRLAGLLVRVPPLRARRGDILLLSGEVLKACAPRQSLSTAAAERLAIAAWPGNARELRHVITSAAQRVAARGAEFILPDDLRLPAAAEDATAELMNHRIERALSDCGGVASHAAKMLGISRTTLYKNLKRMQREKDEPSSAEDYRPEARDP